VPGIDHAADGRGEDDGAALLQTNEVLTPSRTVHREACLRDGDKASTFGETRQRGRDVPKRCVRPPPVYVREGRERRVHQNDGGNNVAAEVVVDLARVETGDGDIGEEMGEEPGARLGQLVQDQRGAGKLGEDGEQAGAGRGFQHVVRWRYRGCGGRHQRQGERRRELLVRLALLGAPCVAREQGCHLRQHREQGGWRAGACRHGTRELAQEQDGRRLAGVVGALPGPGALRVAAATGPLHRGAEHRGIDALPAFDIGKEQLRDVEQDGGTIGSFGHAGAGRRGGSRDSGGRRHGGSLGGEGKGRSRGLSLDAGRLARSGLSLSLW
jgi:hypothetical protein